MFDRMRAQNEAKVRLATADGPRVFIDGFVEGAEWGFGLGSARNRLFHKLCCELIEATTKERRVEVLEEMRKKVDCAD